MDQDAFRKLLAVSKHGRAAQATQTPRGSLLPSKANPPQQKPTDAPKSEFKPRKVKKTDSSYRDRAAERRKGVAGDFAEVEAVLESFEKQHADEDKEAVERQRHYLGGDSEHTVLVKGLDFALLEQTRARAAASTSVVDDEMLEAAFHGAASPSPSASPVPSAIPSSSKKRTREDLVRELKQKRAAQGQAVGGDVPADVKSLEEAKKDGKFKPIGFKPIGAASTSSKTKDKDGKERKKKKRKVETPGGVQMKGDPAASATASPPESSTKESLKQESSIQTTTQKRVAGEKPQEPEPPEDFDIFAEAGEYEGVNFDDDDDNDTDVDNVAKGGPSKLETSEPKTTSETGRPRSPEPRPQRKWFDDDEPPSPPPERVLPSRTDAKGKSKSKEGTHSGSPEEASADVAGDVDAEQERPTRLVPLASSAVPSIRDILAADSALEAERKRRARKEKRKAGGGNGGNGSDDGEGEGKGAGKKVAAEAKLNRDYQKLKAYTEKKGASK